MRIQSLHPHRHAAHKNGRLAMGLRLILAFSPLLLISCQSSSHPDQQLLVPGQDGDHSGAVGGDPLAKDSCEAHLHDIGGTLLLYYSVYKNMPDKLSDLQTVTNMDTPLALTCPVSHKPYNYYPQGLSSQDQERLIVACDPEPSHNGKRWCLLINPIRPGVALSTDVQLIPEVAFRNFVPAQ
jgi:hypothetical protein